jgi:hypothetical protein
MGGMALVVMAKEEANVGRVGSRRGSNKVFGFGCDGVAGGDETSEGGSLGSKGITDDVTVGGLVVEAARKRVVTLGVQGVVAVTAGGIVEEGRDNGETEMAEEANLVVGCGEALAGVLA